MGQEARGRLTSDPRTPHARRRPRTPHGQSTDSPRTAHGQPTGRPRRPYPTTTDCCGTVQCAGPRGLGAKRSVQHRRSGAWLPPRSPAPPSRQDLVSSSSPCKVGQARQGIPCLRYNSRFSGDHQILAVERAETSLRFRTAMNTSSGPGDARSSRSWCLKPSKTRCFPRIRSK